MKEDNERILPNVNCFMICPKITFTSKCVLNVCSLHCSCYYARTDSVFGPKCDTDKGLSERGGSGWHIYLYAQIILPQYAKPVEIWTK